MSMWHLWVATHLVNAQVLPWHVDRVMFIKEEPHCPVAGWLDLWVKGFLFMTIGQARRGWNMNCMVVSKVGNQHQWDRNGISVHIGSLEILRTLRCFVCSWF